ncbi:hypothetical protein F5887DRAFT_961364 [Amanita rubescens]|nr:hypothetical protein F5887DRAFT_961364 [Amanita rubescens]
MPTITTTIEDNSPLLYYDGWTVGGYPPGADSLTTEYSESNFMGTTAQNASMTFRYCGTDVQLYGAQRGNHGRYQVTLDNFTYSPQSGFAPDPGNFQVVLFESHDVPQGNHTVIITNADNDKWLDIDFVTWTSTFGDPEAVLGVTAVDDGDSAFQYSSGDWTINPPNVGKYFSGTGHVTGNYNAKAQLTFSGDAISLYGPVGVNGSSYTVQINDSALVSYNSFRTIGYQMLLYHMNNLGPGNHTLTFLCLPVQQQICGIDYVNIYHTATNDSTYLFGSSGSRSLSTGDVVGIAVGSAAALIALGVVVLYFTIRKKSASQSQYSAVNPFVSRAMTQADQRRNIGESVRIG